MFHLARWKSRDIFLASGGILSSIWLAAFCKPKHHNSCHIRWKCKQINYDPMGWEHPAQSTLTETFIRNTTTAAVSQLVAQTAAKRSANTQLRVFQITTTMQLQNFIYKNVKLCYLLKLPIRSCSYKTHSFLTLRGQLTLSLQTNWCLQWSRGKPSKETKAGQTSE